MTYADIKEEEAVGNKKAAKEKAALQALQEMNEAHPGYEFHIF